MKKSGILLPVFSLPSKYGVGCFSDEAYRFIDLLAEAGQSYWQILPLGPAGKAYSPYAPLSSFAGYQLYIDPDTLYAKGLLDKKDLSLLSEAQGKDPVRISYDSVTEARRKALRKAFERFSEKHLANSESGEEGSEAKAFFDWCSEKEAWLNDYAIYAVLSDKYKNAHWTKWPKGLMMRESSALSKAVEENAYEVQMHKWIQYEFDCEWQAIRKHSHEKSVDIIGDIPIYVSYESADCWASPELFKLNSDFRPEAVSGCPPDNFNANGQVWENPLYNWSKIRRTGFKWWIERMKRNFELCDVVRIDHARGFCSYYSIPADTMKAADGRWIKGPRIDFFNAIKEALGDDCRLIAEDLGFITKPVRKMIEDAGVPSMKILQLAFDSDNSNSYLPANVTENSVMYTGTHDNDTTFGWYQTAFGGRLNNVNEYISDRLEEVKNITAPFTMSEEFLKKRTSGFEAFVKDAKGKFDPADITAAMVSLAMYTRCYTCIIPLQDWIIADNSCRINVPGTADNNWVWRMKADDLSAEICKTMLDITKASGRIR